MMTLEDRITALEKLGHHMLGKDEYLEAVIKRTAFHNGWFTEAHQQQALNAIAKDFLGREKLERWLSDYTLAEGAPKTVGLVLAGNIPLVGFHDWLCVFAAGHRAQVKLSEKDPYLFPYLMKVLEKIDGRSASLTQIVDRLGSFDAVIATGSNNSARYFEAYFGAYPHIIRKNRNGVGVLTGAESREELMALGKDIFQYYGLGCRNVSKLYVPEGYDFEPLLEALHEYREVVLNTKFKNNFDYNYALYVLNKVPFKSNGCILMTKDTALQSRIACLHYEPYAAIQSVASALHAQREAIQCIVARPGSLDRPAFDFGQAQQPQLWDYADGEDTLAFLASLEGLRQN